MDLNPAKTASMRRNTDRAKDIGGGNPDIDHLESGVPFAPEKNSWLHMMHFAYATGKQTGSDVGCQGFKDGILLWSGAYYVAFALLMTVAFAMLLIPPEVRQLDENNSDFKQYAYYRFESDVVDGIVNWLYFVFVGLACYDSTFGMILCAEWQMRLPLVPAQRISKFVRAFEQRKYTELFICCGSRRIHSAKGARLFGCNYNCQLVCGDLSVPAYDPYWFIDRSVQMLFCAGICFVYLSQGLIQACIIITIFSLYIYRVNAHGQDLQAALFDAYKAENKIEMRKLWEEQQENYDEFGKQL